jgi:hypothetical protein
MGAVTTPNRPNGDVSATMRAALSVAVCGPGMAGQLETPMFDQFFEPVWIEGGVTESQVAVLIDENRAPCREGERLRNAASGVARRLAGAYAAGRS